MTTHKRSTPIASPTKPSAVRREQKLAHAEASETRSRKRGLPPESRRAPFRGSTGFLPARLFHLLKASSMFLDELAELHLQRIY